MNRNSNLIQRVVLLSFLQQPQNFAFYLGLVILMATLAGGFSGLISVDEGNFTHIALVLLALLFVAFVVAIHSQRRLENQKQLLTRHHDIIQSINGIVWEADVEMNHFIFVSRRAEEMLGYAIDDWNGSGFWADHVHPDDKAMAVGYIAACVRDNLSLEFEYRFITKGGDTVWLHDTVSVVAENGQPIRLRGLMQDITTRRQQEDYEHKFLADKQNILDNVLVAIVHVVNRHIVWCNPRFEEMFGYRPGEMLGMSTIQLFATSETADAINDKADRSIERGENFTGELVFRRKDGHRFWGAINGRAFDPLNLQKGCVWIYADISQRRQAEEEVHKLLLAVEQSPVSIIITNRDGNIEYVNPRFTRDAGYSLDEIIGQNLRILSSTETQQDVFDKVWSTLASGQEWHGVMHNQRKNGELFWEEASISPILDEKGKITHFLAVNENIDERKQSEDALRASHEAYSSILVTSLDGFWRTDSEANLLDVNDTYLRQSGYSLEELLTMNIADLDADKSPLDTKKRIQEIIENGSGQFETTQRRKDGSIWHAEISVSYNADAGGGGQFFAFLRDITVRKQIQQQLEAHQQNLEELVRRRTADLASALEAAKVADSAKDAFLANISHELRTPLNAVLGLSAVAYRDSTDQKQRDTLKKITDSGQTLLGVINDLLDLTKISAGEMQFEVVPFDLRQIVKRALSSVSVRATEKGLRLDEFIADNVPGVLIGDPLRIEQILLNLLSNAIKFTERGSVELRIENAMPEETSRTRLRIEIIDTGTGLSEEAINHLFKPFSQADVSITRKYGGTGLGLTICKKLAEQMDGSIGIESVPGQGSTFRVELCFNIGQSTDVPSDSCETSGTLSDDAPMSFPTARVLIVDDQPLNREVVVELLATVGIVPRTAENGYEAVEILKTAGPGAFDLVLMDIQMPIMDGLTATHEIRALDGFNDLPVVAMTAHTMEHEKTEYLNAGMNDHIGKPFNLDRFFALLKKWLPVASVAEEVVPIARHGAAQTSVVEQSLSSIQGLNTTAALERFAWDVSRYTHWLKIFVDESAVFPQQIRNELSSQNHDDARQRAHAFKGRAGMLGITNIHVLAGQLEVALSERQPVEDNLRTLSAAIDVTRMELQKALSEGNTAT